MFGHDDEAKDETTTLDNTNLANNDVTSDVANGATTDNNNDVSATAPLTQDNSSSTATAGQITSPTTDNDTGSSLDGDSDSPEETPLLSQVGTPDEDTAQDDSTTAPGAPADEDLIELKKQSLEELAPLVDHLDQTAEEKFRTTMMMIQATDNSSLIKDAHAAALKITDDKIRAQALLDIVNEINYFTQVGSAKSDS